MKTYDMCIFLKEVDSCSLRCAIFNLEDSYKRFFSKKTRYSKFKNKYTKQTYRTNCICSTYKGRIYSNIALDLVNKTIKLSKLGLVKIRGYRNLEIINGNIINTTVERDTTNKYYVSVVIDEIEFVSQKVTPKNIVGIDLVVKDLVVTSDDEKFNNPRELAKTEKTKDLSVRR